MPGEASAGKLRAHIQYMAPLLLYHVRQGIVTGDIGCPHVDPHHEVEALGGRIENRLGPDGAGIINQNVQTTELVDGAIDQITNRLLVANVGGNGEGATSRGAYGVRGLMNAAGQAFGRAFALGCHCDIAPSRASRIARARPMPRLAPATTATRPLRSG